MDTEVLIVGAGPTGLALALWLNRLGVAVRIVDKDAGPGETSRAMVVQARTLELYRQLGIADEVVAEGRRNPAVNLWVRGKRRAHIDFRDAGARLTPFPFVLVYPQDRHERLLLRHLEAAGIRVERRTELLGFEQDEGGDARVRARLRGPDGAEQVAAAAWLAGCDGAHSPVRHGIDAGFEGGTYEQTFYVADVEIEGPAADGEIHLSLEHADFVALMAYGEAGPGIAQGRLIGALKDERTNQDGLLRFEDVRQRAIASLGLQVRRVNWFSTYRVHHRIAERYRRGRAFLLGDAAHVHSPAGGQGMNTGIGDAVNLAWKLAAVLRGRAPDALLDSYAVERQAFARRLVETTDRVFTVVTREGGVADFVRDHVAPLFVSAVDGLKPGRELLFRILSQTATSYHESVLSEGAAGRVRGGDRLPWIGARDAGNGVDNHAPLAHVGWQVHVYGTAGAALADWCGAHGVALHTFAWEPAMADAGLARDAAYLVRPDGYVALADADAAPDTLARYAAARGLRLGD
jgi:2-polyprenyl-6-methoxyphenol hydroxylase-like FAD-dependent oxidoreductase